MIFWDEDWNEIKVIGNILDEGNEWREWLFHDLPFQLSTLKFQPAVRSVSVPVKFITLEIVNVSEERSGSSLAADPQAHAMPPAER